MIAMTAAMHRNVGFSHKISMIVACSSGELARTRAMSVRRDLTQMDRAIVGVN